MPCEPPHNGLSLGADMAYDVVKGVYDDKNNAAAVGNTAGPGEVANADLPAINHGGATLKSPSSGDVWTDADNRNGVMSTNPLRQVRHEGLVVNYHDEVTEEQVRQIDDLVREEFEQDEWVTVEQES